MSFEDVLRTVPVTRDDELVARDLMAAVEDVFEVESVRRGENGARRGGAGRSPNEPGIPLGRQGLVVELVGKLQVPADQAFPLVESRFRQHGYIALFRRKLDRDVIVGLPGELPAVAARPWLAVLLFLATLASCLYVGMSSEQIQGPLDLLSGWPYAASLLGILLAHEFGHYLVSRYFGVATSLPYFIPMPLSMLGTFGAVIQMKAPPKNRRHLLAIAAAGPLAGLAVSLPLLFLGLNLSEVGPSHPGPLQQEGNSLLYIVIKYAMFGRFLPSGGFDVFLHPVAMAAWVGLLVTALNLIPAGQLDGGHIAYALLGERARWLPWGIIAALAGLSFLWNGWLIWVALVLVFGRMHATPLDEITSLRDVERELAFLMLGIFVLVFVPIPIS